MKGAAYNVDFICTSIKEREFLDILDTCCTSTIPYERGAIKISSSVVIPLAHYFATAPAVHCAGLIQFLTGTTKE
jgi:hypothetical protein